MVRTWFQVMHSLKELTLPGILCKQEPATLQRGICTTPFPKDRDVSGELRWVMAISHCILGVGCTGRMPRLRNAVAPRLFQLSIPREVRCRHGQDPNQFVHEQNRARYSGAASRMREEEGAPGDRCPTHRRTCRRSAPAPGTPTSSLYLLT